MPYFYVSSAQGMWGGILGISRNETSSETNPNAQKECLGIRTWDSMSTAQPDPSPNVQNQRRPQNACCIVQSPSNVFAVFP